MEELAENMRNSGATEANIQPVVPETSADQNSLSEHFDLKAATVKSTNTPVSSAEVVVTWYLQMHLVNRQKDPFNFWKTHISVFRELYKLATKYVCVPATSVPCERIFSKAGLIINDRRNRLSGKNLESVIFLNGNISEIN